MTELILASTSVARRLLLNRLELPFECVAPEVDETPLAKETPLELVRRLSESKARAGAQARPAARVIIGSDQIAVVAGQILGKPGDYARATEQLRMVSGQRVEFLTGLCVLDSARDFLQVEVVTSVVVFRALSSELIRRYLVREQPYNCAGAFRFEGLGVVLCDRFEGEDPNALIGLPLMRLVQMLERTGVSVLPD